jgi:hypothetical protein
MRNLLLGAILTLIVPATASAATIQTTDSSQPWQSWSDAAQVPTYAGVLPLAVASGYVSCGGFSDADGCTSYTPAVDQTTGQILPGPPASISTQVSSSDDPQTTFYHELGQVFWTEYMTPADETQFMQIVGLAGDSSNWSNWAYHRTTNGVTLTFPPFEWFAEGYRLCATYGINQPAGVNSIEGLGYPGIESRFAAQQRAVCALIDRVGMDNGIATPAQATYPAAKIVKAARWKHRVRTTWGRRRVW